MKTSINDIVISYTDNEIDDILTKEYPELPFTCHYNHNEESFVKLKTNFTVPHFPIHHDFDLKTPKQDYLTALKQLLNQILPYTGSIFKNLKYFFKQTEIFHPYFYQIYKYKEQLYLYLLRIDLLFKPGDGNILETGSNDVSNSYITDNLYLESDLIPITGYNSRDGNILNFSIEQNISDTWIGETGRGYMLEGIWMDLELTKYLSKLFLPKGQKTYPYYPFTCKYRTFCHTPANLSSGSIKKHLLYLHSARQFILPILNEIQEELKENSFSEDLAFYQETKKKIPEFWNKVWTGLKISTYLNKMDMKEFLVEF